MACTIDIITRACCFTPCLNGKLSSKNYRVCRREQVKRRVQRLLLGHASEY
ncbi:hypothetical protein ACNKHL_00515 [Shigella flexneri]